VFTGAAWVFTRSGSTWSQQRILIGAGTVNDEEGYSVALSAEGNTALIGGPDYEDGKPGAAWVFTRSGTTWSEQAKLVGAHPSSLVQKGWSVALSGDGNTALIGGPSAEFKSGEPALGGTWVFTRSGGTWKELEQLPSGSGAGIDTGQGQSVALSGDGTTALVGGIGYQGGLGGAWIYTLEGGHWTEQGEPLLGNDRDTSAAEGESAALSEDGNTALVGGYQDDVSRGAAWAFVRSGSSWAEQQELVGAGGSAEPQQGNGVALSADGTTALIGGPTNEEDGGATEPGAAWVFTRAPESGGGSEGPKGNEPENKAPTNNSNNGVTDNGSGGSGSNGGGSGSGSTTTAIATTPKAVEELLLGCTKRSLVLNDVLIRNGRVALEGSAAKSLVGKKVEIVFDGGKRVATATMQANGQFSTTAPLPPARLRDSNSARYLAESGSQRSLNLKLTRRLILEPPRFSGGSVTLAGQVVAPLTKPIAKVTVEQQLECGKTSKVLTFTPPASGRFHVNIAGIPANAKAGIYRLASSVAESAAADKHGFATYSLPLPVALG
jgi:hypothetical protein